MLIGLIFDAALIGIIIAVVNQGEFPGWGPSLGCAFAIAIVTAGVSRLLPGWLSLLGIVAGAVVGAYVIQWLCEMSFRKSVKAAGIYLGVSLAFSILWGLLAGL